MDVAAIGRLLVSLAAVLGLMWLIARRLRRPGATRRQSPVIEVVARQQITRNLSVGVVRVVDRTLVVAMSDAGMTLLAEADPAAVAAALEQQKKPEQQKRVQRRTKAAQPTTAVRTTKATRTGRSSRPGSVAVIDGRIVRLPSDGDDGFTPPAARTGPGGSESPAARSGPLTGSALSPGTWRQTFTTLRDLTGRTR